MGPYYKYNHILASGINGWTTSWTDPYGVLGQSYAIQFVTVSGQTPYPPQNYQAGYTNSLDLMIEEVRRVIGDQKYSYSQVARETIGTTSGTNYNETFFTTYLPVVAGTEQLTIGRWFFVPVLTSGDIYGMREYLAGSTIRPMRHYIYDINDGSFFVPSGISRTTGDTVYASYVWMEPKSAKFQDTEIKLFISDALPEINNIFNESISTATYGPFKTITGISNPIIARMLVLKASEYALKSLQETLTADGIYIRDGDTVIDTTKALRDRAESLKSLKSKIDDSIEYYFLRRQMEIVARVDTYSTTTYDYNGLIGIGQYIEATSHDSAGSPPMGYDTNSDWRIT